MVQDVCADVVVDLVEDAIVAVESGQAASQVAPLLHTWLQVGQSDIEPLRQDQQQQRTVII